MYHTSSIDKYKLNSSKPPRSFTLYIYIKLSDQGVYGGVFIPPIVREAREGGQGRGGEGKGKGREKRGGDGGEGREGKGREGKGRGGTGKGGEGREVGQRRKKRNRGEEGEERDEMRGGPLAQ